MVKVTDIPPHPAAALGPHAKRMFEEIVEHTSLRKRASKTSEKLVNAGLVYDRHVGQDEYGFPVYEMSPRLEAYEEYCTWLDANEAAENLPSPIR